MTWTYLILSPYNVHAIPFLHFSTFNYVMRQGICQKLVSCLNKCTDHSVAEGVLTLVSTLTQHDRSAVLYKPMSICASDSLFINWSLEACFQQTNKQNRVLVVHYCNGRIPQCFTLVFYFNASLWSQILQEKSLKGEKKENCNLHRKFQIYLLV